MHNKITNRTFWSNDGWFMNLRHGDENTLSFAGNRLVRIRKSANGVVAGPFGSFEQMESWFGGFLTRHARPRELPVEQGPAVELTAAGHPMELVPVDATRMLEKTWTRFQFG
jgi:hypothetical protein